MVDVDNLPTVPQAQRPKKLFVNNNLSSEEEEKAKFLGWSPEDVRLMPNESMHDRKEAVLACLEGHRMGTISLNRIQLESIELEMKACGLLSNKVEAPKEESKLSKDDVDGLLDALKSKRAFLGTQASDKKPKQLKIADKQQS